MAVAHVPPQISARGRLHLTPDHGPTSPDAATAALLQEVPAWVLDSDGNIQAANRLVLELWGLNPQEFQGVNVFDIFSRNAHRLEHPDNEMFWRAKFRVEQAINPDGLPVFRALREQHPRLDSIYRMMKFEDAQEPAWTYIVKMDDLDDPQQTMDFRTRVSLVLTNDGVEVGFLAEYSPLPGADRTRKRLDEIREDTSAAGSAYVLGERVKALAEDDGVGSVESSGQRDDVEAIEAISDPLPASSVQIASVAVLSVLSAVVPVGVLLLGANSDAQATPIIFILFLLGALVSIGAAVRSAVYRSEYKARATAVLLDLRGALREDVLIIPTSDEDARVWLDELLGDGRDYRDGLIVANCRTLAGELNEAIYRVTAAYVDVVGRSRLHQETAQRLL